MKTSFSSPQVEVDKIGQIISEPILADELLRTMKNQEAGAVVTFMGTVRKNSNGKLTSHLYYEAYAEMATNMMLKILDDALSQWSLINVACVHRVGTLQLGETAVLIVSSSQHRREAYEANQYIIDRVKFELPIWKKEYYTDGSSEWRHNCR